MLNKLTLLAIFLCLFIGNTLNAQDTALSIKEIKKFPICELKINSRKIPSGSLYKVSKDTITLMYDVRQNNSENPHTRVHEKSIYSQQSFPVTKIDLAKVSKKKNKILFATIGAVGLGAGTYFLFKEDDSKSPDQGTISIEPDKRGNNGKAVIIGVVGAGAGASLGLLLSKKKINFKKDQQVAVEELKRFLE